MSNASVGSSVVSGDNLVITRAPLRISLMGGGTDIPQFYRRNGGGEVLNIAIDRCVTVAARRRGDRLVKITLEGEESLHPLDSVANPLVRGCLEAVGVTGGVDIGIFSDIPSGGSGLGFSS
ncbi:hypothetical protein JW905_03780, partial [bacterium]|nr:hypothetical protein [candidate division CSSED10-310 bacterium]